MPFTGTEILQVASGTCLTGCVVDDRWVVSIDYGRASPSGVLPLRGTFAVMDATTSQAKVYTGLPTTSFSTWARAVEQSGFAWFTSGNDLWRITPSTGVASMVGAPGITAEAIAGMGGRVYLFTGGQTVRIWDIATGAYLTPGSAVGVGGVGSAVATNLNRIVVCRNSNATAQIFDAAGALVGPVTVYGGTSWGRAISIGAKAYMPRATTTMGITLEVVHSDGVTATSTLSWGAGRDVGDHIELGSSGWIYGMARSGQIVSLSPVTGVVDASAMPTVRSRRWCVFSAQGQLWVPSGDPL